MDFTFLHAADLHLGSPLTGLALKDEDVARRFAAASREAFSDLVTQSLDAGVRFVVIAGDVYDGEWKDNSVGLFFNREIARLARAAIPVFLVKGNHDAASVVTKTMPLPAGVTEFRTSKAETHRLDELKVALHGRSFQDRSAAENYAVAYPDPVPGYFNIGVLHTSCDGRPPHANYAPCTIRDLAGRGYHYWALGHVHEHEVLSRDPWVVFPGNIQGRSVRECGPKGAMLVDVANGEVGGTPRRLIVDKARWASVAVDLAGAEDDAAANAAIESVLRPVVDEAQGRLLALRLTLRGATPLHRRLKADGRRYADDIQAIAHHLHEDVWLERLRVETAEPASASGGEPSALDPAMLLDGLHADAALRERARAIVESVAARIPGGVTADDAPLHDDLDALMADAHALVLGRATASKAG